MSEPRLSGAATAEGTRRGAESFGAGARTLGRTGYVVSPVGFGGYRVRDDSPLHRRALADALRGGINLVDTSTNYGDGRSEALVGMVLANLVQQGELRREHVVVVSKAGYLQGQNLARAKARPQPFPQVVSLRDDLCHCIHPEFLRAQLDESLGRLGLHRLDVLLLHNPEYYLEDAHARGEDPVVAREELRARLRAAFAHLEQEVADGRIGWYGVSSNGFVLDASHPTHTSLTDVVTAARAVGGEGHHLGVVQMPMNLLELGALTHRHPAQGGERSPLQVAEAEDLGVLTNRPLNAWGRLDGRDRLMRLADQSRSEAAARMAEVEDALARVRKLEAQWATGLGQRLRTGPGAMAEGAAARSGEGPEAAAQDDEGDDAVDLFRWGRELARALPQIGSIEQWQALRHEVVAAHLAKTSGTLLAALEGEPREEFARWWEAYGTSMHELFVAVEHHLGRRHRALAAELAQRLDPHLPAPWRTLPLARKVVLSLLSAPISSVLVGMRQPGYVADMLSLREHPVRLLSAAAGAADLSAIAASFGPWTVP
ncbi:aldo/keto reductase [Paraliomyxa miuraensis]|uniref:aldo/keto reductase n=1 Tax=Paraliomyxa miuraensis TaxID=376150 RepID=UPI00225090E8|nr:aldo/keto reductase [Paraliomyxa miuraensis]MCX4243307.1 aldo/keto reductase [Paraliomyxa miuraensis]